MAGFQPFSEAMPKNPIASSVILECGPGIGRVDEGAHLPGIVIDCGGSEIERRLHAGAPSDIVEAVAGPVTERVDRGDHVAGVEDRRGDVAPGVDY